MSPATVTEPVVFIVVAHSDDSIGMMRVARHEIPALESSHFSLSFLLGQFLILNDVWEAGNEALCIANGVTILIYS